MATSGLLAHMSAGKFVGRLGDVDWSGLLELVGELEFVEEDEEALA